MNLPKTPLLHLDDVIKLIPQRHPIIMVDKMWYNDESTTISGLRISADNVFCESGKFTEPGLIENIAQTAALRLGLMAKEKEKAGIAVEPPIGFIGAVKKLIIEKLPTIGEELRTTIIVENVVFGATIISGEVHVNELCVASCEMKIFLKE